MRWIYPLYKSVELFFLLPACFVSKKMFDRVWRRYYVQDLPKSIFNLCVQWLLYVGRRTRLSYNDINVLIFCIIWPAITLLSFALNVVLLIRYYQS